MEAQTIILSANQSHYHTPSLTHPDAFKHRIDIRAKVKVKGMYVKTVLNGQSMVDTDKVYMHLRPGIHPDIYDFEMENVDGQPTGECWDGVRFVRECLVKRSLRRQQSTTKVTHLTSFARDAHNQMLTNPVRAVQHVLKRSTSQLQLFQQQTLDLSDETWWHEIRYMTGVPRYVKVVSVAVTIAGGITMLCGIVNAEFGSGSTVKRMKQKSLMLNPTRESVAKKGRGCSSRAQRLVEQSATSTSTGTTMIFWSICATAFTANTNLALHVFKSCRRQGYRGGNTTYHVSCSLAKVKMKCCSSSVRQRASCKKNTSPL